jgi:large subunit ribosomal protein L29
MKMSELREKTVEDLKNAIVNWKKDLFGYRLQLSVHKLENTAAISKTKRSIAQAKTVVREKELDIKPKAKKTAKKSAAKSTAGVKAAKKPAAKKSAAKKSAAKPKAKAKTAAKSKATVKKTASKSK